MSAATVTDFVPAQPAARPAAGRAARSRGAAATRLRPVPGSGATASPAPAGAGRPAADSVTVTVRVGPGGAPDGVLAALRDLIAAAGAGSTAVDIQAADIQAAPSGTASGAAPSGTAPSGTAPAAVGQAVPAAADSLAAPAAADSHAAPAAAGAVVQVHAASRTVTRDGRPLPLSRLEYDLLLFLAKNPRRVFSRSQLLGQVWGHTHTSARSVDVHVSRLRTKLGEPDVVTTVYGVGYRLADDSVVTVVR